MYKQKNMLLIGATGSNLGKTEFACRLINRFAASRHVVGVKATAITEPAEGFCPRGGAGCGVCTSLGDDNYCITTESGGEARKDTVRMKNSGAHEVYWLRALESKLAEGFSHLREYFNDDAVIICESNRLRLVVEPGLFIMVGDSRSQAKKPSVDKVIDFVDKMIYFNGTDFDFNPDRINYGAKGWEILSEHNEVIR